MDKQLTQLGLPYCFFDAIHGARNPDHPLFKKYNDKKRARLRGSGASLRLSQLGCFASHYLLWEKCVQARKAIIVLEDDAILLPEFMSFYENAAAFARSEEHTSELQVTNAHLVCRLLIEKKKNIK